MIFFHTHIWHGVCYIIKAENRWYENVLSKQNNFKDSQIADTIWCNDKSITNGDSEYGNYYTDYAAYDRLTIGQRSITLICSNDNQGGKLSRFTASDTTYGNGALNGYAKVGLLTADEIAFAGGAYSTLNSTYYIKGNTNSSWWWASSPGNFIGDYAVVWVFNGNYSSLGDGYRVNNGFSVRPSLSLQLGVKISSSGIGSATNPYKIAA